MRWPLPVASPPMLLILTALALAIGIFLLLLWGNFWRCDQRLDETTALIAPATDSASIPSIGIVIPARNEAKVIAISLGSLLNQSYAGPMQIVLVDDLSSDGTGAIAAQVAA